MGDTVFDGSVRTARGYQDPGSPRNKRVGMFPPYEWGMVNNPQGGQAPGGHKAQPLLESWRWVRAQIGSRPSQHTPDGAAGQSSAQKSNRDPRPSHNGGSFDGLYQDSGPSPMMIQRFFRTANTGYSGVNTVGRSASGMLMPDGDNAYVIKRPLQRYPTRGPRSVSGAMNPKSRFDDTGRLPSVFVPTTPLR